MAKTETDQEVLDRIKKKVRKIVEESSDQEWLKLKKIAKEEENKNGN